MAFGLGRPTVGHFASILTVAFKILHSGKKIMLPVLHHRLQKLPAFKWKYF